jgi:hypothetical protein
MSAVLHASLSSWGVFQVRLPWGAFTLPNSYITISLDDVVVESVLRKQDEFCVGAGSPDETEVIQGEGGGGGFAGFVMSIAMMSADIERDVCMVSSASDGCMAAGRGHCS